MKLRSVAVALLASTNIAHAQTQTPTQKFPKSSPNQKAAGAPKGPPTEQLPFADARNMTLMIFFADPPPMPGMLPVARGNAVGSGVWIGRAGYVATCYHVVKDWHGPFKVGFARSAFVNEGGFNISMGATINIWTADLIASDPDADVAILKAAVTPEKANPVAL